MLSFLWLLTYTLERSRWFCIGRPSIKGTRRARVPRVKKWIARRAEAKATLLFFSGSTGQPPSKDRPARSSKTESCRHSSRAFATPPWHPLPSHERAKTWAWIFPRASRNCPKLARRPRMPGGVRGVQRNMSFLKSNRHQAASFYQPYSGVAGDAAMRPRGGVHDRARVTRMAPGPIRVYVHLVNVAPVRMHSKIQHRGPTTVSKAKVRNPSRPQEPTATI